MIALIDYGAGNLTSVKKALTALGVDFIVPTTPEDCAAASGLIVPGVGHFSATTRLDHQWRQAVRRAIESGTPLLGICVGMQWLFDGSEEAPGVAGLGALSGTCRLLQGDADRHLKVPHVGWNALDLRGTSRLTTGLAPGTHVYFTHSFAAPVTSDCVASATHVDVFAAAVEHGRVFGVQFHPEKSGPAGLQILRNYLSVCREGNAAC